MVPTMIAMTMAHPNFTPQTFGSLRRLTYGASPMPAALLDRLLADYPKLEISQGYGMTESAALLTVLGPEDHVPGSHRLHSAGQALPGVALTIQDERGHDPRPAPDRRGVRPLRQHHARVLEPAGGDRRPLFAAAGTTPATPATSTRTAISSSSTGSRT